VLQWAHETAEIERMARTKEMIYRDLVRAGGIAPMDGVVEWLGALRASGIPCAIASSTQRLNIDCVMEQIRLGSCFQAVVSGDEVTHGKPDPKIFLLAARRLGVPPERCVVFEDAHVGIEAARAAGMRVVAVTTTNPREALNDADLVVDRLDELTADKIDEWFV
jgi:HAD superfamily hydrolase (TIGR01509 family)